MSEIKVSKINITSEGYGILWFLKLLPNRI